MKKLLLLGIVPALLFGDDLKSLLEFAKEHNNLLQASKIKVASQSKVVDSVKSSYYPTVDAGAFYKRDDASNTFQPGTTYGAQAKIGFTLYDGGKNTYTEQQKKEELHSASSSYKEQKRSLSLRITQEFYTLKSLYASLDARVEATKAVKAQLIRVKDFYDVKLATNDDVDRLESAYDKNLYAIESLKFQILKAKKELELQVGKKIERLDDATFKKVSMQKSTPLQSIIALKYRQKALHHSSQIIESNYYPIFRLEDSYTLYGYADKPKMAFPIKYLDNQNEIMATLNIRLFDFGALREQKEATLLQEKALDEQIIYKTKEQKMQLELSRARIETAKLNIKSSKSALKSAITALHTITQKYSAGIVDNVVYLDALSNKTEAEALYKKSLNDLEIAYATYYYYNSKNLEEFLQ